jgi:uncharacterized protein YcnI
MTRRPYSLLGGIVVGASALLAGTAFGHVTLATGEAPVGAAYKAVLRIPHGCDGTATIKISVQVPDGVIEVKPQPKPGWQIATVKGTYAAPFVYEGTKLTEGVKEVIWSGGNLPDAFFDEFVFLAFLTDDLKPGAIAYFPVVQECEKGIERWIEIPAAGKGADDYERPAPGVRLLPNAGSDD